MARHSKLGDNSSTSINCMMLFPPCKCHHVWIVVDFEMHMHRYMLWPSPFDPDPDVVIFIVFISFTPILMIESFNTTCPCMYMAMKSDSSHGFPFPNHLGLRE